VPLQSGDFGVVFAIFAELWTQLVVERHLYDPHSFAPHLEIQSMPSSSSISPAVRTCGLESFATEIQPVDESVLDGRWMVLVDIPGFDDTTKRDTDVLKMIAGCLAIT
jgi:hypothetical protein